MENKVNIPEKFEDFLHWFKERTEGFWSSGDLWTSREWMRDAKWIGMTEEQINAAEEKYGIRFSSHHKAFLKVLHTIDVKEPYEAYDEMKDEEFVAFKSYFYNWLTDEDELLREMIEYPYNTISKDVFYGKCWLPSWGKRPDTLDEQEQAVKDWYKLAPKVLPIFGHRFVVSEPIDQDNPVLSIWGSDTIVYGNDLKHYLLYELSGHYGMLEPKYDEDYKEWYNGHNKELTDYFEKQNEKRSFLEISSWIELLRANGFDNTISNKEKM